MAEYLICLWAYRKLTRHNWEQIPTSLYSGKYVSINTVTKLWQIQVCQSDVIWLSDQILLSANTNFYLRRQTCLSKHRNENMIDPGMPSIHLLKPYTYLSIIEIFNAFIITIVLLRRKVVVKDVKLAVQNWRKAIFKRGHFTFQELHVHVYCKDKKSLHDKWDEKYLS